MFSSSALQDNTSGKPEPEAGPDRPPSHKRLLALDVLRGLAILIMLLVNNFGDASKTPQQLQHAGWGEPIHLADMAFPWFLFCVGVAIPFSVASARRRGLRWWQHDLKVLRRTIILILLGTLLDTTGDGKFVLFSVGVLQTIALSYFITALLYGLPIHRKVFFAAAMLIIYWAAIKFLPIPGAHPGVFTEGTNFIRHIQGMLNLGDHRTFLGWINLWNLPRIVPTTALVLIGTAVGDLMRTEDPVRAHRVEVLVVSGLIMAVLAEIWNLNLPFNKWVWTPAYVMLSAGTATLLLGLFYMVADVMDIRKWAFPFVVFGSNAILIYVVPIAARGLILSPLGIEIGGWFRVIVFILFWWLVSWLLYRKRWFLRV